MKNRSGNEIGMGYKAGFLYTILRIYLFIALMFENSCVGKTPYLWFPKVSKKFYKLLKEAYRDVIEQKVNMRGMGCVQVFINHQCS